MREWAKRKPDRWDTVSEISGFTTSEVALSGATASPSGGHHGASARSKDSERHLNRGQGTRKLSCPLDVNHVWDGHRVVMGRSHKAARVRSTDPENAKRSASS